MKIRSLIVATTFAMALPAVANAQQATDTGQANALQQASYAANLDQLVDRYPFLKTHLDADRYAKRKPAPGTGGPGYHVPPMIGTPVSTSHKQKQKPPSFYPPPTPPIIPPEIPGLPPHKPGKPNGPGTPGTPQNPPGKPGIPYCPPDKPDFPSNPPGKPGIGHPGGPPGPGPGTGTHDPPTDCDEALRKLSEQNLANLSRTRDALRARLQQATNDQERQVLTWLLQAVDDQSRQWLDAWTAARGSVRR